MIHRLPLAGMDGSAPPIIQRHPRSAITSNGISYASRAMIAIPTLGDIHRDHPPEWCASRWQALTLNICPGVFASADTAISLSTEEGSHAQGKPPLWQVRLVER